MRKIYRIAIDGSTTSTGVACFNKKWDYETHMVFAPHAPKGLERHEAMEVRIREMLISLQKVFAKYQPQEIVMEDTYASKDMYAYKKMCHLQGLVLAYGIEHQIPVTFVSPQSWRKDIGIPLYENRIRLKRDDFKKQSIAFVKQTLGLEVGDDAADAICLGLSRKNKKEKKT